MPQSQREWDKELEQFLSEYGNITEESRLIARDKFMALREKYPLIPTDKRTRQWAIANPQTTNTEK